MNLDDILWVCYRSFDTAVDTVSADKLVSLVRSFFPTLTATDDDIVERVQTIREYRKQLEVLKDIPYIAQRTQEWYDLRKQRLTASDTAQAIGVGKFGTRDQLVQKKVNEVLGVPDNFPKHLPALKWGVMFEAMASRCYAQSRYDINIHEFGLIAHPKVECYGASPDGITDLGIMIEIKCPYKRKITGQVPEYYELQIQGQMAVCGLKECDYVECEMQEFESLEDYYVMINSDSKTNHGVIVEYSKLGEILYDYSDPYLSPKDAYMNVKSAATQRVKSDPDLSITRIRPWRLRLMNVVRVHFDQDRWDKLVPKLQQFWKEVLEKRALGAAVGTAPAVAEPQMKKKKYDFIAESDDES